MCLVSSFSLSCKQTISLLLKNSSFVFAYEITYEGAVKAKGKTVQVAVDEVEQKSRPLTDEERAFLTEYLD